MTVDIAQGNARGIASIYNSAVAAWAIAAAWEIGALDELHRARTLDTADFAARAGLDPLSTTGLFRALASVGLVRRDGAVVHTLDGFDDMYRNKSFFHWLTRGSAELFRQMPAVLRTENRTGDYYHRDAAAIAYACREIDQITYAPTFWAAMDRVDFPFSRVADLGCGSGARLMQILDRHPGATGVGVDIAQPSLDVARKEAAEAGFADRAEFVHGDVLRLQPRPEYADIELLTCFMMGHDFWPRENCVATLRRLREVFPAARRLLIGDATRTALPDTELPVFTLGFELGHDLMGTFLPTVDDWESVFEEGGWKLVRTNRIDITVGEVIFELA
ncbi:methyltransferase domain-containing protein [Streptomyces sp. DSM 118148]|uniref:methyltransferase domain-containing protein n=1 Tax=Streptomyces sp. DSM 118148 TaxID=3448667 RepID=UPI00403FFD59